MADTTCQRCSSSFPPPHAQGTWTVAFAPPAPDGTIALSLVYPLDDRARLSRLEQLYCALCIPAMIGLPHH